MEREFGYSQRRNGKPQPWLLLNAWPMKDMKAAAKKLGVEGVAKMNKPMVYQKLLGFPQQQVLDALGWKPHSLEG